MAWIHQKPDANSLQTDPSFHDVQTFTLIGPRQCSAFDPWANSTSAPGNMRRRTIHIGVHEHDLFMSEYPSSTLLPQGASDYLTHPIWNTVSNCNCAQDGFDPGGLPTFALTPTSTSGTHYYGFTAPFPSGNQVVSFYVKANGYTGLGIGLWDDNAATYLQGNFDLSTGTATAGLTVSSVSLDGGWYRVWCSRSFAAGASANSNMSINIGSNVSTFSFSGDGVSGILVTQPFVCPGVSPTSWISSKNICPHSTDVSDGSWSPEQLTVTANQVADPISGAVTAALLTEDSTNNIHLVTQTVTAINGLYICHSAYYKPSGRTWLLLNNGPTGNGSWFNCSGSGTIGTANGAICSAGIKALTGPQAGWYYCWFTSQAGTSNNAQAYMSTGDTVSSYLGTGTACGYLADYQVEPVGLTVTPYPDSLNIVQSANNLADTAHWSGGSIIGVSSFVTDPFGGTNAFTLTNGSGGIYDALFQPITVPAGPVLISFYIKHGNTSDSAIQIYDSTAPLGRGLIEIAWTGSAISSVGTSGGMVPLGCGYLLVPGTSGWYRIMVLSSSGIIPGNANGIYIYPGQPGFQSAGNFCYGYGPQITALTPTSYWGITSTVGSRDQDVLYADISSIVDSRINLAAYSEQFDNATWQRYSPSATVTPNNATDPNNTMYASTIAFTGSGNDYLYNQSSGLPQILGQQYTLIMWMKSAGKATGSLRMLNSLDDSDTNHTLVTLTGSWQRVVVSHTFTVSGTSIDFGLDNRIIEGGAGDAGSVQCFGAQLVPGSDPGANFYLPTHSVVGAPQVGLSTTKGTVIALGIPYDGNVQSGNYYSHVGNADFVMDPAGQFYRGANSGGVIHETLGVLDIAVLTWDTDKDEVWTYGNGAQIGFDNLGESNRPVNVRNTLPIGWQFGGNGNYNGWVGLFYVHGRAYTYAEQLAFFHAIENA